jgi:hypothetical protein
MIFLIDVRSLNLNSCPVNSEHVFSCDELVQFGFPCAGSYLVVNNSEVVKHHPSHVQRELDSSKTDVFYKIMNKIIYISHELYIHSTPFIVCN